MSMLDENKESTKSMYFKTWLSMNTGCYKEGGKGYEATELEG